MISKSWGLTIFLYAFATGTILLEVFSGIVISESQYHMILGMLGISTTAGTTNAVFGNRNALKKLFTDLKNENSKAD